VFATMRRKSRSRRMKNELGQSMDHFKRAASLAAQETGSTVGPRVQAAVGRVQPVAVKARGAASSGWESAVATLSPLVTAATVNARQAGKVSKKQAKKNQKNAQKLQKQASQAVGRKPRRRGSKLVGFALVGTALGVGAAYVAKRRKSAQWDEYDPAPPISSVREGVDDAASEPAAFEPASPNGTLSDPARQTPRF
jgi:hypothetical protein